jgi:CTP:molybdopterin cytidylyltransferase MocA
MGSPKPLLLWHGVKLIEYQIDSLLKAGVCEVIAVLGHCADEVKPFVKAEHCQAAINPGYKEGKTTSITTGLKAISPDASAILLLAVDQPRTPEIISQVIRAHTEANALITSPRYQGHGGHPLIFSATLKGELAGITEQNQGIREVFEKHRDEVIEVNIDDPMLRLDLNTPDSYDAAKKRYSA